jgi:hypothetical protein
MLTAGLAVAAPAVSQMTSPMAPHAPMTKVDHATAKKHAGMQYKVEKDACASLAGNTRDVCMTEAKGHEKIALAEADAAYANTPKSREKARTAHAQAARDVAVEKCDDLAGNPKDVCVKEADALLVRGKADAKVDRVAADARRDAAVKVSDVKKEANVDKRDADFNVAIEKCDALAGTAKDACVGTAKTQYGKS